MIVIPIDGQSTHQLELHSQYRHSKDNRLDVLERLRFVPLGITLTKIVFNPLFEFQQPIAELDRLQQLLHTHKEVRIVLFLKDGRVVYIVNVNTHVHGNSISSHDSNNGFFDENVCI